MNKVSRVDTCLILDAAKKNCFKGESKHKRNSIFRVRPRVFR